MRKMRELTKLGTVLLKLAVPKSCQEYRATVCDARVQAMANKLHTRVRTPYLWPWLLRSYLVMTMRKKGIKALSRNYKQLRVQHVLDAWPDQKLSWTTAVPGETSVKAIFRALKYDGPLELFTMFYCLFNAGGVERFDVDIVWKLRRELVRAREAYTKKHKLTPHPLVLLTLGGCHVL